MKATLVLLLIAMNLAVGSHARTDAQPIIRNREMPVFQSPELDEAARLTLAVVKLFEQRKYEEAFPLAKRALELRDQALGKDDELSAAAAFNLAEIQWQREKYDDSRRLFERALHSYERILGRENIRLAAIWERIALVYYAYGQPAETESFYKRSLAIREQALGPEHSDVGQSIFKLAEFYQFQGDYKKAEPLYERLLEIRGKTSAATEPLAEAIDRYACLLRKEKRTQEADQIEEREFPVLNPGNDRSQFTTGGVVNGKALKLVQPPYPMEARAGRASGKVSVRVLIDERGDVTRVCAFEGHKLLMKASESAAARSKFSPTTLDGKPVKVTGIIIYNYVSQ